MLKICSSFEMTTMYRGDLNTNHLNTKIFEVLISNGWFVSFFVCTRSTIQILDQYMGKQGIHCPVFKCSSCLVFKQHSNTTPFGIQPLGLFEYQASLVIRSPLYFNIFNCKTYVYQKLIIKKLIFINIQWRSKLG